MLFHVRQIEIENFRALNAIDFSKIQMLHFHSCYLKVLQNSQILMNIVYMND